MIKNFLTFDLENWYDSEFVKYHGNEDLVEEPTVKLLDLLKIRKTKATFFVLGKCAEMHPEIVKKIYDEGHEIASHGYNHKKVNLMSQKEFEKEIKMSKRIIKKIVKKNPKGFRAPMWSIDNRNSWAIDVLEKNNFEYDSSLFPINMRYYGISKIPANPYKPSSHDLRKEDTSRRIIEVPVVPYKIMGMKLPFSGGVYFRIMNLHLTNFFLKNINMKGTRGVFYFHPWEFADKIPKVKTGAVGNIVTYFNIKNNLKKLNILLENNKFTSICGEL